MFTIPKLIGIKIAAVRVINVLKNVREAMLFWDFMWHKTFTIKMCMWYSTFFVPVPPGVMYLQLCTPRVDVQLKLCTVNNLH
jgi:hypothetical protein